MTSTAITNFNEIAIRAPCPGFFVGDYVLGSDGLLGAMNPIVKHYELSQNIPRASQLFPLGSLTRFPNEILHGILSHLDILSVLEFRSVNHRSAAVVTSSHDFNIVATFPKVLGAVVTMRCHFYSMGHLVACLIETRCSKCKSHFGDLLYLITAERVCWSCWRRFRDFIPMSKIARATGLSIEILLEIPHIFGVPGFYGEPWPLAIIEKKGPMFDRRAVIAELKKRGYDYADPDPEPHRAKLRAPKSAEHAASLGRLFEKPKNLRYIAFLRAPYFDQEARAFIGGYFCRACIGRKSFHHYTRYALDFEFPASIWHEPWRKYTREGFWKHIEKYGPVFKTDLEGTFAHDSLRGETQTPDDVQWEMYKYEDQLLSEGMEVRDDHPIPFAQDERGTFGPLLDYHQANLL